MTTTATRRPLPADDSTGWSSPYDELHRFDWSLEYGADDPASFLTYTRIRHAGGVRGVRADFTLSEILDSLIATKVGRRAILDALRKHES